MRSTLIEGLYAGRGLRRGSKAGHARARTRAKGRIDCVVSAAGSCTTGWVAYAGLCATSGPWSRSLVSRAARVIASLRPQLAAARICRDYRPCATSCAVIYPGTGTG